MVTKDSAEDMSRDEARELYWGEYDKESYECPTCDRGLDEIAEFHVHHKDGDPMNNDLDNLVGLCHRCHMWDHNTGPTLEGLSVREWKEAFAGESQFESLNL